MKRSDKSKLVTLTIILFIIIISLFALNKKNPETDSNIAKCIGENSILYVQLGCSHCERQKDIFGDNYEYINSIDCFYERNKCQGISATPTWVINGEKYVGVKSIQELKKLTSCG